MCELFRLSWTPSLIRERGVGFFKCCLSMLRAPKMKFLSPPLCCREGRDISSRDLKTLANKPETISLIPGGVNGKKTLLSAVLNALTLHKDQNKAFTIHLRNKLFD